MHEDMRALAEAGLVVLCGGLGGLAVLTLLSALRLPAGTTRRKRRPLRALTTPLPMTEVRSRLTTLAANSNLHVVEAENPERIILVQAGRPAGWEGPGHFFPVYLEAMPDGGTRLEVGIRRKVPAIKWILIAPLDNCVEAIQACLDVDASARVPQAFPAMNPDPVNARLPWYPSRGMTFLVLSLALLASATLLAPWLKDSDDDIGSGDLVWQTTPAAIDDHSVFAFEGTAFWTADDTVPLWIDRAGNEHRDSWPACLRGEAYMMRFAYEDRTWPADRTVPIAAIDCRGLTVIPESPAPRRRPR